LTTAAEHLETVVPDGDGLQEVVGDKGYHSNQSSNLVFSNLLKLAASVVLFSQLISRAPADTSAVCWDVVRLSARWEFGPFRIANCLVLARQIT
jgi:hypothetical protein